MEILTILQLIEVVLAYLCMTLLLPAILLYPKIKTLRFSIRFITYQIVGNFFMMNLVFILELMRISNRVTLTASTVVLFAVAFIRIRKKHPVKATKELIHTLGKLAGGQLGVRLFLRRVRRLIFQQIKRGLKFFFRHLPANSIDIIFVLGLTAALVYAYGINLIRNYGFCASDIPVHHYWINYLARNEIFVAGIYPMGFHCVNYYLRTVFGIPTYVLMRIFCFVQTMMIHFVLLAFIKSCCKSKYAGYIGLLLYTIVPIFGGNTFSRYFSSLPQEFGMLFILPSVWFLYAFFEKKEKRPKENIWYLACFAMSFSMTISVHFYDTMIAGLCCLGVAVGYAFRLFRRKVFGKVMLAGILSVFIAVLPMGIAFAMGTPLQGSLGWGLNVITGANNTQETQEDAAQTEQEDTTQAKQGDAAQAGQGDTTQAGQGDTTQAGQGGTLQASGTEGAQAQSAAGGSTAQGQETGETPPPKDSLTVRLMRVIKKMPDALMDAIEVYLIPKDYPQIRLAVPAAIVLLAMLSAVYFIFRRADYAARLLSTAAFMVLLSVLFSASRVGLPALMDAIRTCIFYAYILVVAWSLCIDAVLSLFFDWFRKKWLLNISSLLLVCATVYYIGKTGMIKDMPNVSALETNAAVTCFTNILHDNDDFKWTICSANDELRMGEDYGYHYEVDTFLQDMEHSVDSKVITIPTPRVYFFIEKIPLDYSIAYEGSGQSVSEEGARRPLPKTSGISMYMGENRWIEMSRMYYWAQSFMKMYPNEMKVYYETDDFVCYVLDQEMYSLFNLAIDYGYNR